MSDPKDHRSGRHSTAYVHEKPGTDDDYRPNTAREPKGREGTTHDFSSDDDALERRGWNDPYELSPASQKALVELEESYLSATAAHDESQRTLDRPLTDEEIEESRSNGRLEVDSRIVEAANKHPQPDQSHSHAGISGIHETNEDITRAVTSIVSHVEQLMETQRRTAEQLSAITQQLRNLDPSLVDEVRSRAGYGTTRDASRPPSMHLPPQQSSHRVEAPPMPAPAGVSSGLKGGSSIRRHGSWNAANKKRVVRIVQVGVGLLILSIILVSLILPYVLPVSGNSVVNARLSWIHAPIDGYVRPTRLELGDQVEVGQDLGVIYNPRVDESQLNDLETRRALLKSRRASQANELKQLEEERILMANALRRIKNDLLTDIATHRKQKAVQLETLREDELRLTNQLNRYEAVNSSLGDVGTRPETGTDQQQQRDQADDVTVIPRDELERLKREHSAIQREIELAELELQKLRNREVLIEAERFSGMDRPIELLRLEEATKRINELHLAIQDTDRQIERLSEHIITEKQQIERLSEADLDASVSGPLWQRKVGVDTFVSAGDKLFATADASSTVVEAYIHQRHLDQVLVGDKVYIHLLGADRVIEGTVRQVHIRDEKRRDDEFAYNLTFRDEDHFKIAVSIEDQKQAAALIGQRARVLVAGSSPGLVKRLLMNIYQLVGF